MAVASERHSSDTRPLLFISHRQDDAPLADALREWITLRTGGSVRVFQHDAATAESPRIGNILNAELSKSLRAAGAVVLLFTTPDKDWSYCMFECGVAYNDEEHATRVIVFQCAGFAPKVFEASVCVDVHNAESVFHFANTFLTDRDFFPNREQAVSGFLPNSDDVRSAAQDLYDRFSPFWPQGAGEWAAHPFLRVALGLDDWNSIVEPQDEDEQVEVAKRVIKKAVIKMGEGNVASLLGSRDIANKTLGDLLGFWEKQRKEVSPAWYEGLCRQMMRGDQATLIRWDLMRSADNNDTTWYAPAVMRIRRIPGPGRPAMEYDVYFCRFNKTKSGAVEIGVSAPGPAQKTPRRADAERDDDWVDTPPTPSSGTGPGFR